jgi:hypothetical protein
MLWKDWLIQNAYELDLTHMVIIFACLSNNKLTALIFSGG